MRVLARVLQKLARAAQQLLADGEVFMGSTYNGRLFSLIEEQDQPVGMMWDAQVFDIDGWIIPEGLGEAELARVKDFVKFATDTQRLADQAAYISYGPARDSSAPLVGQHAELGIEMAPHMPTDPANSQNTFVYNYEFWADYRLAAPPPEAPQWPSSPFTPGGAR